MPIENIDTKTAPTPPTIEIDIDKLEAIMQPDEVLAAQLLDRTIQTFEDSGYVDDELLTLLRFQRTLIDIDSPVESITAGKQFATETGKYATFHQHTQPTIHFEINRGMFMPVWANIERWNILGIDPSQYDVDSYHRSYRKGIEESWADARRAQQALFKAQAEVAVTTERVANPPAFEPKSS